MNDITTQPMRRKSTIISRLALPMMLTSLLISCSDNQATSVWDPELQPSSAPPVISSISPEGGYLAGVDAITITGSGFSTIASENKVYFSNAEEFGVAGLVLSSTATQLEVRPPKITGDVTLKAYREGAENFSNELTYSLASPLLDAYDSFNPKADNPISLGLDNDGNLFVALTSGGNARGIIKIDTEGTVSDYVLANNRFRFDAIDFSPDNRLYICVGIRAVFQGTEGAREGAHFIMPAPFTFMNFDMDENGYMWLVGDNTHIVRHVPQVARVNITNINSLPDNTKIYPLDANLTGVFYYSNALYLLGSDEAGWKVWKADLDSNSDVSGASVFVDLNEKLGDVTTAHRFTDIVMAADGMVYVSTNRAEGILEIAADGSTVEPLYEGVLYPVVTSMDWGDGVHLYISTTATSDPLSQSSVVLVNMQKEGAPDY